MSSNEIISQIFCNSTELPGRVVVEKMVTSGVAICPEFAEPIIQGWIDEGLVLQQDKNLVLPSQETVPQEPVSQGPSTQEIKEKWFQMRQYEKTAPKAVHLKVQAEAFEKWCGWKYFIFDYKLRKACEAIGFVSPTNVERNEFQKLLQS